MGPHFEIGLPLGELQHGGGAAHFCLPLLQLSRQPLQVLPQPACLRLQPVMQMDPCWLVLASNMN